ncbi:MAG: hypothetical protein GXP31_04260 [Kiritimatiellaeota bacterium]|nr:hypothetical protein [Kiritimatiellota bacterium]
MIERTGDQIIVRHPVLGWEAVHPARRLGGPLRVTAADGTILFRDVTNCIDDLDERSTVLLTAKAFRKGGTAIVAHRGFFPFGGEVRFEQTCRYAANHVRVTLDVGWPGGSRVRRRVAVGSLFLPGAWKTLFTVPPPPWTDQSACLPVSRKLPPPPDSGEIMVAHWHRPPPAVVLGRGDGTRVEIGTGGDLWRWQHAFGAGPENGSWKLFLGADGMRFVREPIMTCAEFAPAARPYRLTWYAAWWKGARPTALAGSAGAVPVPFEGGSAATAGQALALDLQAAPAPAGCKRTRTLCNQVRGVREDVFCWACNPVQKPVRRVIRRLAAQAREGTLILRGVVPGTCWDPRHLGRKHPDGLPHWDMPALLDFAVWTRRQLGPHWRLQAEITPAWAASPALAGMFGPNGFEAAPDALPPETAGAQDA